LASGYGVGLDNLMAFYQLPQTEEEIALGEAVQQQIGLPFQPYVVKGSQTLLDTIGVDMNHGVTVTTPGFYAPQGRQVRIATRFPELLPKFEEFVQQETGVRLTNFEMETAAYYGLSRMLGHEALSVNAIIANRIRNEFAANHYDIVDNLIRKVLDRL